MSGQNPLMVRNRGLDSIGGRTGGEKRA